MTARPADSLNRNVAASAGSVTVQPVPPARHDSASALREAAVGQVMRSDDEVARRGRDQDVGQGPLGLEVDGWRPPAQMAVPEPGPQGAAELRRRVPEQHNGSRRAR